MSKVLIFDHNARERQRTVDFLAKADADFGKSFAAMKAEFAAAKTEPDSEKRRTIYACIEKRLESLGKEQETVIAAHRRLAAQRRKEVDEKFEKLAGLLNYGLAVGMIEPADAFILSCLKDARAAASESEKFAFYDEAILAFDGAYGDDKTEATDG